MLKDKLKILRNEKNLTQESLAKILNVSVSTISMYETGSREPDLYTLARLSDYYGVTTDYLLDLSDNPYFNICKKSNDDNMRVYVNSLKDAIEDIIKLIS